MDAVSALVTVPPTPPPPLVSSAIASEVAALTTNRPTSANASTIHHANQSNNNIQHSGTNSLSTTAAAAALATASNVGSHSSNSSCSSSSSSSSNSSGYGSTTTTPTNNYDFQQQQQQQQTTPTTTPIPTTPIAIAEPIIPVATVAAVTPFYNESIATHNLEQQQQQQQHSHHLLQQQQHHQLPQTTNTHQYQYQQHQHQPQPQPQYLPRQQYYPTYADYQQSPPPTHNFTGSASPSAPAYNMGIPGPYEISPSAATSYAVASQYKTPGFNYERSAAVRTTPYNQPQQMSSTSEMQNKPHSQQFGGGVLSSTKQRSSSLIGSSSNVSTSKPQAAATPFYAQPLAQSHTSNPTTAYYENVKHKMSLEYHEAYGNNSPAAANTYHQQQKYYAAAKSQLKEAAAYGSPPAAVGLGGKSLYSSASNFFPSSPTAYDKYLYPPHVPAAGYSTSQHVGSETPPDQNNYRKPVAANQLNSTSWPWGIDYNAGNSRTIPPPPPTNNHIPTATVAPTHATYLTPNPTREPFYMGPEKYALKYDKYAVPPAYQQTYANATPSRHHMWPSSAAANNLAPLNDRHPPHGLHSPSPYFSANTAASALNSRQSCCNQPYQTQNCYYPAPTHAGVNRLPYNPPATVSPSTGGGSFLTTNQQPPPLGQSPHLNALTASCKFGSMLTDYGNVNKVKNTNDLYLSSHRYDTNPPPPPPHNYGYGSGHSSSQSLYASNTHQSMVHGPHDPMTANSANYTNDLSLTTSNFDSYHTHLDNHLVAPQTLAGMQQHNPQQQQQQSPPPAYAATVAKRALLDYRRPIQPQPPPPIPPAPTINEDGYSATRNHPHYNQQDMLNTPETTTSFNEYEPAQESSSYIAHKTQEVMDKTNSIAESGEGNKNLSLRDFIANWNDDEEDYQNNEEMNFDQSSVIQEVLHATPNEQQQAGAVAMEVVTLQQEPMEVLKSSSCSIETKEDNQIIEKDFIEAVPPSSVSASSEVEPENSQYTNLPDIIIDIEKSSNSVNNSTLNLSTSEVTETASETNNSLNLTDFDVEKELDELKIKKPMPQNQTKDLNDINDPMKSVNTPQLSPSKNLNTQLNFEELNLEHSNNKTEPINTLENTATRESSHLPEHYFKDMEGYESGSSRHSNESAFEKEYETFINRITHETGTKFHDKSKETDQEVEFAQNVQDFSKFYKCKRKLKEDELKSSSAYQQYKKKLKSSMIAKHNNSNFPQVYTKKSRNRKSSPLPAPRRKPFSLYYKFVHSLRHIDLKRLKRARDYLTELKEKHLPLIKRQSIKNYSHCLNDSRFKPQTLKALCIVAINTEEFRQRIIIPMEKDEKKQFSSCLDANNDKHICPDPTCETCEVLRSLMASESFETPALEPANDSVAEHLKEVEESPETITVIDEELNIVDLNLKKDEYIVMISTDDENLQILDATQTVPDDNAQSELETETYFAENSVVSPATLTPDNAEQFSLQTVEVEGGTVIPTTVPLAVEDNVENENPAPALETLITDHKVSEIVEDSKTLLSPEKQAFKDTEKESENSDSCDSDSECCSDSASSSSSSRSSSSSGSSSSSSSSTSSDDEASEDEEKENSIRNPGTNHLAGPEDCKNEKHDSVQSVDPKTEPDQEISVNFHKSEDLESSDSEMDDIVTEKICPQSPEYLGNSETKENLLNASANTAYDIPTENLRSIEFQDAVRSLDSESSASESEDDEKVKKISKISSIAKADAEISDDESISSIDSEVENNQEDLQNSLELSKENDIEGEQKNQLPEHQETHQDELANSHLKDSHENLSEDSLCSEEGAHLPGDVETGTSPQTIIANETKVYTTNDNLDLSPSLKLSHENLSVHSLCSEADEHLHGDVETETSPQIIFANETKVYTSNDNLDLCPSLKLSHENLSEHSLCSEEDEIPDNDLKPTNLDGTEPMLRKETMPLKLSQENLSEDFLSTDNEDSQSDLKADENISTKSTNLDVAEPMFEEELKENIAGADLSMRLKDSRENLTEDSLHSEEDESSDNDLETAATNFNESEANITKEGNENSFESPRDSNEEDLLRPVLNQERDVELHTLLKDSHENLSVASLSSENNENSDNDMETVRNLSTSPTNFDQSERIFAEAFKSPEISDHHCDEEKRDNVSEYSLSSVENDYSDTDTESVKSVDEPEEMFTKVASKHTAEKFSYSEASQECSSEQTSLEKDDPENQDQNIAKVNFKLRTLITDRHDNLSEDSLSSEDSANSDSDIETDTNVPKLSADTEKASEDFNYQTFKETFLEKENQESQSSLLENNVEISKGNDLCSEENFANKFPKNIEEFSPVLESENACGNTSEEDNSNEAFHQEMNESKRDTFQDDFMQHIVREYRRAQVSASLENLVSLVNSNQNPEVVLPARETLLEFSIENETANGNPKESLEGNKLNEETALDIDQESVRATTEDISDTPEQNFVRRDAEPTYYSDPSETFPDIPVAELYAKNLNPECKNLEALSEYSSQYSESDESISEMEETNMVIADPDNTKDQLVSGIPKALNKPIDQDAEEEIETSELKNFSEENEVNDKLLKETDIQIESIVKDDENVHDSELEKENQLEDMEVYEQQSKEQMQQEVDVASTTHETESIPEESPTKLDKVDEDACDCKNSEFLKAREQAEVIRAEDSLTEYTCKGNSVLEPKTLEEFDSETAEENHYIEPEISKETATSLLEGSLVAEELNPQISENLERENCNDATEKFMEGSPFSSFISNTPNKSGTQISEGLEKDNDLKLYADTITTNVTVNIESEVKVTQEFDTKGLTTEETETGSEVIMLEASIKAQSRVRAEQEVSNAVEVMSETENSQMEALDNSAKLSEGPEILVPTTEVETVPEIKPNIRLEIETDRSDFHNEAETDDISLELAKEIPPNTIPIRLDSETHEDISLEIQKENSDVLTKPCGVSETSQTVEEEPVPETIDDISLEIQKDVSTDSIEEQQNSRTKVQDTTEEIEIADISTELCEEKEVYQPATEEEAIPQGVEDILEENQKENSHVLAESFRKTEVARIRTQSESVLEGQENISTEVQKEDSIEASEENTMSEIEVEDFSPETEKEIPDVSSESDVMEISKKFQEENLDAAACLCEETEILQYPTEAETEYSKKEEIFRSTANMQENPETIDDNSLEIQKEIPDVSPEPKLKAIPQPTIEIESDPEAFGATSMVACVASPEDKEIPADATEIGEESSEEKEVSRNKSDMENIPETLEDISVEIQNESLDVFTESEQKMVSQITTELETDSKIIDDISLETQKEISNVLDTCCEETTEDIISDSGEKGISRIEPDIEDITKTLESEQKEVPQIATELETYSKVIVDISNVPGTSCGETTEAIISASSEKGISRIEPDIEDVTKTLESEKKEVPKITNKLETYSKIIDDISLETQKEISNVPGTSCEETMISDSGKQRISQITSNTEDITETLESEHKEIPQIAIDDDISLERQKEISNVSDTSCIETTEAIISDSSEQRISQIAPDTKDITETVEDSSHICTEISIEDQTPLFSSIQDTVPETYENRSLKIQKQVTNDSSESFEKIQTISKIDSEANEENLSSFGKFTSAEALSPGIESSNKFSVERDAVIQSAEQNSKTEALPANDSPRNSTESPLIAEVDATNSTEESSELQDPSRSLENSDSITKDSEEDSSKSDLKISHEKESSTNEEEFSGDFYGFKNQSSFEDESGDFHGFEDLEEVARIRQEIEQLNEDDSAANDGFLNYAMLNKELHKTSTNSLSAGSSGSEINELEALEKELSQHQTIAAAALEEDDDKRNETEMQHLVKVKAVSTNDIEHIKQMLESDEEAPPQPDDDENKDDDNNSKVKFEENSSFNSKDIIKKDIIKSVNVNSIIPKLSDLCRAALNSSLHSNRNLDDTQTTATVLVERELSVEEALAEMYRQAGVLLSDPEDCDNETTAMANDGEEQEAHDVLLINLQEILNSDNNDVYVLQCNMNDSVLNVMPTNGQEEEQKAERVNTLQFIGILDTQNNEPQIHIISSDSESEVIILSDDDDESDFMYRPYVAQHEHRVAIPFINDNDNVSCGGNDSLSDISTIHHEEIVPDNLNKFLQEEFYKYLHEKYVQRNISKYYHANRVIKKYRKRYVKTKRH